MGDVYVFRMICWMIGRPGQQIPRPQPRQTRMIGGGGFIRNDAKRCEAAGDRGARNTAPRQSGVESARLWSSRNTSHRSNQGHRQFKGLLGSGVAPWTSPPLRISAGRPADACLAAPELSSLAHPGHPTAQTATRQIALHGSPAHRSSSGAGVVLFLCGQFAVRQQDPHRTVQSRQRSRIMNNIIWLVGAVVIILFVLGYFGLR